MDASCPSHRVTCGYVEELGKKLHRHLKIKLQNIGFDCIIQEKDVEKCAKASKFSYVNNKPWQLNDEQ